MKLNYLFNKKIILLIIILILNSFVNAENLTHGIASNDDYVDEVEYCLLIQANDTYIVDKLNLFSGDTSSKCWVRYKTNRSMMSNIADVNSLICDIDNVDFIQNEEYMLCSANDNVNRNVRLVFVSFPINQEKIFWQGNTYYDGSWHDATSYIPSIESITTAELTTHDTINISETEPLNGTEFNTVPVNLNATVNSSTDFACDIIIDGTNLSSSLYSAGQNVPISYDLTTPYSNGLYSYYFSCYNLTGGNQENSTNTSVFIDITSPIIDIDSDLLSNISFIIGADTLTGQINFSDDNLYGINITLNDGVIIFNQTQGFSTTYQYNLSLNPQTLGLNYGKHIITIESSDGHTTAKIPEYEYKKDYVSKAITYEFEDDWIKVEPLIKDSDSKFETWKETDRYKFKFEKGSSLETNKLEFRLTSSQSIDYIENSKWNAHFVVPALYKWIDFDSETKEIKSKTKIKKISDKEYIITLDDIFEDYIIFDSIGGLNVNTKSFQFYYGNITETYQSIVVEGQSVYSNLTFIVPNELEINYNISYNFNYTNPTLSNNTKTIGDLDYVTFCPSASYYPLISDTTNITANWTYELNINVNNIINYTDDIQIQVYNMNFSSCNNTVNIYPVIHLEFFDEITSNIVNATTTGQPIYIKYNEFESEETITLGTNYTLQYCTNVPNDVYYELETWGTYLSSGTGYNVRFFEIPDTSKQQIYNGTPYTQNILLTATGNTTTWTSTWYTQNLQLVSDATLYIYKYQGGTRTLIATKPINTGVATENLVFYSSAFGYFYSFAVLYEGTLYTDSQYYSPIEIVGDNSFTILNNVNLLPVIGLYGVGCNIEKSALDEVKLTWDSGSIDNVTACIYVDRLHLGNSYNIYSNCTFGTSGTIERTLPISSGNTYIVYGTISDGLATSTCLDTVVFSSQSEASKELGTDAIFAIILLILVCVLIWGDSLYNLIGSVVLGILASWILGVYSVSWSITAGIIVLAGSIIWIVRYARQ